MFQKIAVLWYAGFMKLLVAVFVGVLLLVFSNQVAAADIFSSPDPYAGCIVDGIPTLRCIPAIFGNLINTGIALAGIVAVFFITTSGIKFITSGGDPGRVAEARRTLTFAVVGLLIVVLSFTILKVVGKITGTDCKVLGIETCKK